MTRTSPTYRLPTEVFYDDGPAITLELEPDLRQVRERVPYIFDVSVTDDDYLT